MTYTLDSTKQAFLWGYGHYFIFSAAAVGAGLAVAVDYATGTAAISHVNAGLALAIPVAIYVFFLGLVHGRIAAGGWMTFLFIGLIAATLVTPFLPDTALSIGILFAVFLGAMLWVNRGPAVA